MIDAFVLLTPIFLLGVVALLGFVGCGLLYGVSLPPQIDANQVIPDSGPSAGGTSVQILGSDFAGVTKLTFGGVDAVSFSVISDTEIDAVTPSNSAGPVDVVLTRASDSVSNVTPLVFTYVAIGFVQTASIAQAARNPPISVTLNNTVAGNLLITAVSYAGTAGSVTVADNLGNAFIHAGSGPWRRQSDIFYFPNIPGGNVTITATNAGGPCSMCVSEYSGADPTSAAVYGFSTSFLSNGTAGLETIQGVAVSPAQPGDIVYVVVFAAQDTALLPGPGFDLHASTTTSLLVEDIAATVTATQTVATDDTTGGAFMQWVILAVAIKA